MDRTKPEHVNNLPKDKSSGLVWTIVLGVVLLATMIGAWQIYIKTAMRWEQRFNAPLPLTQTPQPQPQPQVHETTQEELNVLRAQAKERLRAYQEKEAAIDKCINGTAFRRLQDGGWENIKGVRCN